MRDGAGDNTGVGVSVDAPTHNHDDGFLGGPDGMATRSKSIKAPAFQFYPKDFLTDEDQAVMSLDACGAYARLMCHCWLKGTLPDSTLELSRLCGATPNAMKRMWPEISRCFRQRQDGRWIHPRLEKERQKQKEFRERQAEKAALRWEKSGNATASRGQSRTHALQSSISSTTVQEQEREPKSLPPLAAAWNELTSAPLPKCVGISKKRTGWLKARMAERSLDEWRDIISRIERSSFCRGLTGGGTWVASFDWLIGSADTALKVLEGKYDDRTPAAVVPGKSEIQREFERKYGDMRVDLSRRQA